VVTPAAPLRGVRSARDLLARETGSPRSRWETLSQARWLTFCSMTSPPRGTLRPSAVRTRASAAISCSRARPWPIWSWPAAPPAPIPVAGISRTSAGGWPTATSATSLRSRARVPLPSVEKFRLPAAAQQPPDVQLLAALFDTARHGLAHLSQQIPARLTDGKIWMTSFTGVRSSEFMHEALSSERRDGHLSSPSAEPTPLSRRAPGSAVS